MLIKKLEKIFDIVTPILERLVEKSPELLEKAAEAYLRAYLQKKGVDTSGL